VGFLPKKDYYRWLVAVYSLSWGLANGGLTLLLLLAFTKTAPVVTRHITKPTEISRVWLGNSGAVACLVWLVGTGDDIGVVVGCGVLGCGVRGCGVRAEE
jgi:hypothetical protein